VLIISDTNPIKIVISGENAPANAASIFIPENDVPPDFSPAKPKARVSRKLGKTYKRVQTAISRKERTLKVSDAIAKPDDMSPIVLHE
jgi:hypothetical protein